MTPRQFEVCCNRWLLRDPLSPKATEEFAHLIGESSSALSTPAHVLASALGVPPSIFFRWRLSQVGISAEDRARVVKFLRARARRHTKGKVPKIDIDNLI